MQSFLGGGDKGGSSNPLKQLAQGEGQDRSVFRDRQTASGPQQSAFRPPVNAQHSSQPVHAQTPHPFNLSRLASALSGPSNAAQLRPPQISGLESSWNRASPQPGNAHWSTGFDDGRHRSGSPLPQSQQYAADWASGFQESQMVGKGKGRAIPVGNEEYIGVPAHQPYPGYAMSAGMGMGSMGMPYQPSFQPMYAGHQAPSHATGSMNGHLRSEQEHREMEAAFERALEDARAQVNEVRDEGVQQELEQQAPPEEEMRESKGELEKVWESLRPEAERLGKLAEWEKDFSQFTHDEDDLFDTLNDSLNRSDVGQTPLEDQLDLGTSGGSGLVRPDLEGYLEADDGVPRLQPYDFASSERYSDLSPMQALVQARAILSTGGSLTDAAHLLESYLQRATAQDHVEAQSTPVEVWTLLGRTHAMNEKEEKALSAFAQGRAALQADAASGGPIAGELLTNLAISYVNESLDLAALTVLHQFLATSHSEFAGQAPARSQLTESSGPWALHQGMTDLFLALARHQYNIGGQVDPDVQVGLGTLYYMMGEYAEARDCWVNALNERPDDYLLWNRLGATLANGGNPEEAVDAYRRALELRPTFTRAIFNLGVACKVDISYAPMQVIADPSGLNIGVYREAAEQFLAALSLHDKSAGEPNSVYDSSSLWATLRRALSALNLDDLAAKAIPGADLTQFRAAGFDF